MNLGTPENSAIQKLSSIIIIIITNAEIKSSERFSASRWCGVLTVGVAPRFSTDSSHERSKHPTSVEQHEGFTLRTYNGRLDEKVCSLSLSKSGAIWHINAPNT